MLAQLADLGLQGTAARALVARSFTLGGMARAKLALSAGVLALAVASLAAAPVLVPLLLYAVLSGWCEFLGVALRARGRRGAEAAVLVSLRAAALAGAVAATRAQAGLHGLAWALALSAVAPLLLAAALARGGEATSGGAAAMGPILRASLPLGINGGLALASVRVELFALALLRGAWEAGIYAAALRVVDFLILVPAAISAGAMPSLTREALRGVGPARQRTSATIALIAVPAAAGLALTAPGLVVLLFGRDFAPAGGPLAVLSAALVPVFLNSVLLHALIAAGRAPLVPLLTGARLAAAVVLALAFVPRFGAVGGALGFAAAETLMLLLAVRACGAARFAVPVARPVLLAAGFTVPMAAAVALLGRGPLASAVVGVAAYGATLLLAWRLAPRLLDVLASDVRGV